MRFKIINFFNGINRFLAYFLLLNAVILNISFATSDYQSVAENKLRSIESIQKSVWKISNEYVSNLGTGFFISPTHFVTNFHVIDSNIDESTLRNITLSQGKGSVKLSVKRILALSLFYDLVILETKKEVKNHLILGESILPHEKEIFTISYLNDKLRKIEKINSIFANNSRDYAFPSNVSHLKGTSGSPIINNKGQVVGILCCSSYNIIYAIKVTHLQNLLTNPPVKDVLLQMKEEVNILTSMARQGDMLAQYQLAIMYKHGIAVPKDYEKAKALLEEAARQGFLLAKHTLANMYMREELPESEEKAFSLYKEAAEQGFVISKNTLADIYMMVGEGSPESEEKAFSLYKEAAEQGFVISQYRLIFMYKHGIAVPKDYEKAKALLEKVTEYGLELSQLILFNMFMEKKEKISNG